LALPFFNPGWLAGTVGGAAPIIIHLLNKQRYRRMWWAAMEFLRQAVEKRRRRLRIEHLILLAIRTLILILLAFVLSRPFLGASGLEFVTQSSTLRVFVIDNSYSMGYDLGGDSALERGRKIAVTMADQMRGQDASCVIEANESPVMLIEQPLADKKEVRDRLAGIELSDRSGDLPRALEAAVKIAAQNEMPATLIYVVTDLQQVDWQMADPERQAALEKAVKALTRRTQVLIIDVGALDPSNMAVAGLDIPDPIIATLLPTKINVHVANFSDAPLTDVPVELFIDDQSAASDVIPEIKPAATAVKTFPYTFQQAGFHAVRVQTRADALTPDDRAYLAVRVRDSVKVLIVDGDPGASPRESERFYLALAMQPEERSYAERRAVTDPKIINDVTFEQEPLDEYDLVVLANVAQITTERIEAVRAYVDRGGALMIFMGDLTAPEDYSRMFAPAKDPFLPMRFTGVRGSAVDKTQFVGLKVADETHPVMQKVVAYTAKSLAGAHVYRYVACTVDESNPAVHVLARFNDELGTPAIVEFEVGKGRVCYVGTSTAESWSNLGERIVFYPIFINETSQGVVQSSTAGRNLAVGERFVRGVTPVEYNGALWLTTPRGEVTELTPDEKLSAVRFGATDRAGVYTLELRATEATDGFVVNLDTAESSLTRINEQQLEESLPKAEHVSYEIRRASDTGAVEGAGRPESEIWKTLALILGVLVCLESFLAWKFGRYR